MTIADLIYSQISEHNEQASITVLDDGSGVTISIPKRKKGVEYVIELEFDGEGKELIGASVYKGEIIESIHHKRLI